MTYGFMPVLARDAVCGTQRTLPHRPTTANRGSARRPAVDPLSRVILLLALLVTAIASQGRDLGEFEREVADRLEERGYTGELMHLDAVGGDFLVLLERSAGQSVRRAAIILHGMGQHLDWPDVVSPLRNHLPETGWSTLSVQCPLLSPIATWNLQADQVRVAMARIRAARSFLEKEGAEKVVMIGYGYGAALAALYLSSAREGIAAAVLISAQAPPYLLPVVDPARDIAALTLPVLDVYGSNDHIQVLDAVAEREPATLKDAGGTLDQLVIEGADHAYHGQETLMTTRIAAWLDRVTVGAGNAPAHP